VHLKLSSNSILTAFVNLKEIKYEEVEIENYLRISLLERFKKEFTSGKFSIDELEMKLMAEDPEYLEYYNHLQEIRNKRTNIELLLTLLVKDKIGINDVDILTPLMEFEYNLVLQTDTENVPEETETKKEEKKMLEKVKNTPDDFDFEDDENVVDDDYEDGFDDEEIDFDEDEDFED
jgi:hypothetical protein